MGKEGLRNEQQQQRVRGPWLVRVVEENDARTSSYPEPLYKKGCASLANNRRHVCGQACIANTNDTVKNCKR